MQWLIALGQGVSLLPAMVQERDPTNRQSYRMLADHVPTRTIAAAWHRRRYHGPAASRFLECLHDWVAKQPKRRQR